MLALFAVAGTLATAYLAGRSRRWTALGVALAPGLILASFVNWDLIAMGLVALGMAAWAARRSVLAGVLLGLAVATKFYPLFFFGPLLLLCLRAGRMRAFAVTAASAAVAWLAVNLPVALAAPAGWERFYSLSTTRPADWGSIWYYFETEHWPFVGSLSGDGLNALSALVFAAGCVLIAALILAAPRRPRVPQVFFLVLAVFLLANKVWSPQYVVWLVPLVVLAQAPGVGVRRLAGGRGRVLLRHLGLPDHRGRGGRRSTAASARGSTSRRCCQVRLGRAPVRARDQGHPATRRPIWCALPAMTTRPAECSTARRRVRAAPAGGRAPVSPRGAPAASGCRRRVGGLGDRRGTGGADDVQQQGRIDRARLDGRVAVPAGAELVTRVVAVHQVDPAGDGLDPVHDAGQVVAARDTRGRCPGRNRSGLRRSPSAADEVPDGVPEALHRGQAAGHRVVAARGVLDQQGYRPLYPLDRLAPVGVALAFVDPAGDVPAVHDQALGADRGRGGELLAEQLAAGNPDPVVRAGHVDAVRRVDEHLQARLAERGAELARVTAGERRRAPALRVAEEELDDLGTGGARHRQRVTFAVVGTDANHAPERRQGRPARPAQAGSGKKPPCAKPRAVPTNAATSPVTMIIRSSRVAEIICA